MCIVYASVYVCMCVRVSSGSQSGTVDIIPTQPKYQLNSEDSNFTPPPPGLNCQSGPMDKTNQRPELSARVLLAPCPFSCRGARREDKRQRKEK